MESLVTRRARNTCVNNLKYDVQIGRVLTNRLEFDLDNIMTIEEAYQNIVESIKKLIPCNGQSFRHRMSATIKKEPAIHLDFVQKYTKGGLIFFNENIDMFNINMFSALRELYNFEMKGYKGKKMYITTISLPKNTGGQTVILPIMWRRART